MEEANARKVSRDINTEIPPIHAQRCRFERIQLKAGPFQMLWKSMAAQSQLGSKVLDQSQILVEGSF